MLKKFLLLICGFSLSTTLFAFNDSQLARVIEGEPGKKAGDVIQPTTVVQVAAWCDFSKAVVNTNRNSYLCVYNGKNPAT